ncbi:MAG TPA: hypothetical protein VN648_29280 [Candidatus Methylomirabilis sp.]|nr:hypothetical protein [Candidatus Methylomirabilis sp.]
MSTANRCNGSEGEKKCQDLWGGRPDGKKFAKRVALLKEYPGRTAIELEHLAWRPESHGDLTGRAEGGAHRVGPQ